MKSILLQAFIFVLIVGCKEPRKRFDFQIINETAYRLNHLEFRYGDFSKDFEIDSKDSSAIFNWHCSSQELLGPCTAYLRILEYEDTQEIFNNLCGLNISRTNFEEQEKVVFTIWDDGSPSDSCPNNVFRITY